MVPDPYARYLEQADQLFASGEVVKAGQIWQAILKQSPEHAAARDGLLKVRIWLQAQADANAGAAASPEATQALAPVPALARGAAAPVAAAPPPPPPGATAPEPPPPEEDTQIAPPAPEAPAQVPPSHGLSADDLDRMMREGATLFDMGQVEDALQKWEGLLRLAPDHALTREYVEAARRELGLPPLGGALPAPPPEPVAVAAEISQDAIEEAEKLLREGCMLWDMGLSDDAIAKWRRAHEVAPHRTDIQQFLDNAEKELSGATQALTVAPTPPRPAAAPPPPPPPPAALSPEAEEVVQTKLRQADHLIGLQRLDEAAYTLQQALRHAPGDLRIQEALARCQPPSASSLSMTAALKPPPPPTKPAPVTITLEVDDAALEPTQPGHAPQSEAVQPPESLTRAASPAREGLKFQAPDVLGRLQGMPWLREPKVWAIAGGAALIISVGAYLLHDYRRDAQLKSDVESARARALSQAAAEAEVPTLTFTREAAGAEAQEALSEDPVRAYLLSQFLLKQNPGDTRAAQTRQKALSALAQGGAAGASLEEFQKHLVEGNLDAAHQVMDALLRLKPDDPELRGRAARLERALAEDHAAQGHFDEAKLDLMRGRAFQPEDPAWQGRLRLLDQLRAMPKPQRVSWTSLLG
ncbi:MAG TPA: hypothetical protein VJ483_05150 [Holophagaceae bacterium]|nr:hypothetical protein [Holophagaceae bacterium]